MKLWFILIFIVLSSCKEESKLTCYQAKLIEIQPSEKYRAVMESAHYQLPLLRNKAGLSLFQDSTYIDSVVIDSAVFFNQKGTKCLMLILQQTEKTLYVDQIRIIQGTSIGNDWVFRVSRMPEVPETIFTIPKAGPRSDPSSNGFKQLSKIGRQFVLDAGTTNASNCEIDEKYWFGKD